MIYNNIHSSYVQKTDAVNYIKCYINKHYSNVYDIKIREIKYDKYTENWASHISFNDDANSHELAIILNNNTIIFVKEFK